MKPLSEPFQFWTKRNGDARCSDVLDAIRENLPLVEAARPLVQSLLSNRNTVIKFKDGSPAEAMNQELIMVRPILHATSQIHMMHIPKTAGYSLRSELNKRFFFAAWPRRM